MDSWAFHLPKEIATHPQFNSTSMELERQHLLSQKSGIVLGSDGNFRRCVLARGSRSLGCAFEG
jgi:hypothetical protein